jgi:predicted site-specific integrase-resolvase
MSETAINGEKYYTIKQASENFGIAYATIYSACKQKRIDCRQVNDTYMISESSMREYIDHKKKRMTVPSNSRLTIDDIAEEIIKRINEAYDTGYADGRKAAKAVFTDALKDLK